MHLLPDQFDLSPFVGAELLQAQVGRWQFTLIFEGGHSICCEGDVTATSGGTSVNVLSRDDWGDLNALLPFLGAKVKAWHKVADDRFDILFTDAGTLEFRTAEGPYEDFVIDGGACVV
ncbi:MAG: hypothetical protein MUF07_11870 [Steroidobacteraceae bacterium]|jgi:hypothetical protein|nr:hypothetical protein [Steroidobacteraceae bacterium]